MSIDKKGKYKYEQEYLSNTGHGASLTLTLSRISDLQDRGNSTNFEIRLQ